MPEPRLPRKGADRVVDVEVRHAILGLLAVGAMLALILVGGKIVVERGRIRRQQDLLDGAQAHGPLKSCHHDSNGQTSTKMKL